MVSTGFFITVSTPAMEAIWMMMWHPFVAAESASASSHESSATPLAGPCGGFLDFQPGPACGGFADFALLAAEGEALLHQLRHRRMDLCQQCVDHIPRHLGAMKLPLGVGLGADVLNCFLRPLVPLLPVFSTPT